MKSVFFTVNVVALLLLANERSASAQQLPPSDPSNWQAEDPVPSGYHVTTKPRTGLIIGGASVFGSSYVVTALTALLFSDSTNRWRTALIPGIGPLVCAATAHRQVTMLDVISSAAQLGGLTMMVIGAAFPKSVLVRDQSVSKSWLVRPYVSYDSIGVAGAF